MYKSTYSSISIALYGNIRNFIDQLVDGGIPLDMIDINDFSSSYPYRVYIGIHYQKNGTKSYQRFSKRDVDNCIKWFSQRFPTLWAIDRFKAI